MTQRSGIHILDSLGSIAPAQWDALAGDHPFVSHAFLHTLQETGCTGKDTGWQPCHLTLWKNGALAAAMPLYEKTHSYGEYVFDWAWADAYHRHGLNYYPKLVCASPFTPVCGPRVLAGSLADRRLLIDTALACARDSGASSLHCLFPDQESAQALHSAGMMMRSSVQFHWQNEGFPHFEAFLARMNHDKRKKVRQERRKVESAGIVYRWASGTEASPADWRFFIECYNRTYREHHSSPYLNLDFFLRLTVAMPENLLLIIGERDGTPVACALNVLGNNTLYGRYWGSREFISGLHFETCYYQAIEFCIARGIARFEGGAQGEHKLARGLLPVATVSGHWLAHPEFATAVSRFLERETRGIGQYVSELEDHSPFKASGERIG